MAYHYTVYKTGTGEIVRTGTMAQRNWCYMQAGDGESIFFGMARWDQYMVGGQPVDMPPRPSEHHTFDYGLRKWVDSRTLAELKDRLTADVADLRWQKETSGIEVDGISISTTREARAEFKQLLADAAEASLQVVDFKAASGFVTLTVEQMRGIARAITAYVQSQFSAERMHQEAIAALTSIDAALAYDINAGWPTPTSEQLK
jgi:hypothetical protein